MSEVVTPASWARPRPAKARSRVSNGNAQFIGGDCRSRWTRRWRDLVSDHIRDLTGGEGLDALSAAQVSLIRRAATLEIELEHSEGLLSRGLFVDLGKYAMAAGHLSRILRMLGIHRVAKDVMSLETYLASKPSEAAE